MTKSQLFDRVAAHTNIEKAQVLTIMEAYFAEVKNTLATGHSVTTRGFGSFHLKQRRMKNARDIHKNRTIVVPAHAVPTFRPAIEFKELVKDVPVASKQKAMAE